MGFIDDLFGDGDSSKRADEVPSEIFNKAPRFFVEMVAEEYKLGEDLYKWQIDHLSSAIIVDDYAAPVKVDKAHIKLDTKLQWGQGALLSGSFVMNIVSKSVGHVDTKYDDIDIYFKCKADAQEFATVNGKNGLTAYDFTNPMCAYGFFGSEKVNLIYGVEYDSPEHLISRFDIRACSMAIDPALGVLYVVRGSIQDATRKILTFNPVPRGVSVRRLEKYVTKGFKLDTHQGLFFADLIKTDIYSPTLELMTKAY